MWNEKSTEQSKLHRAFSVFIFNSQNKLLMQKRSAKKVTFPLHWANTCCSHPLYTENELDRNENIGIKNAAKRRLEYELGIPKEQVTTENLILSRKVFITIFLVFIQGKV